jgi:hypothetical protein
MYPERRVRLRRAIDYATAWLATDAARALVVADGHGAAAHWTVPVAALDAHVGSAARLRTFLQRTAANATRPHPRLVVVRWDDHYTAVVIPAPPGRPVLFDAHAGARPRVHTPPPLDVLRAALPNLRVMDGRAGLPTQTETADTFCMVWSTMFRLQWEGGYGKSYPVGRFHVHVMFRAFTTYLPIVA